MEKNINPSPDELFVTLADFTLNHVIESELAYHTARLCLMDALGCAILALQYPACTRLLGPIVPGTMVPLGSRVPGTTYELDPILAAFNIGAQIRWLDFNDTWLALEWGHPSDNLGAILSIADFLSRKNMAEKKSPLQVRDLLTAMIKAYEIQGVLALGNCFNRLGLDHVVLVKVASAAVSMQLLGGDHNDVINVLSQVLVDGQSLRTYRHAPNTGSRKSWAAADATSRALRFAMMVKLGEMGYPRALTAKTWGFNDVILNGQSLRILQPLNCYVMENILFKVNYPAEFHAQTAVECAVMLHPKIKGRFHDIEKIIIKTQQPAMRIINKVGPLCNPADRDHCLQYMVAVALLFGELKAEFYEYHVANHPTIDFLREKMLVEEDDQYSHDYLDPKKRAIPNSVQIYFKDHTTVGPIEIAYPLGHKIRRKEAMPSLLNKFSNNLSFMFPIKTIETLTELFLNPEKLDALAVNQFMQYFIPN